MGTLRRRHALLRAVLTLLLLGVFLTTSCPAPVFAAGGQVGTLSGTVVDAGTRAPIANVRVTAASASGTFAGTTNGTGFFAILGVTVDTYNVSFQAEGYDPLSLPGITVVGDQTINIGSIGLNKPLKTIAKVTARGTSGAFQPNQTIDSYTIGGARLTQVAGKAFTTNENNVLLAIPGVTITNANLPTIRGGAAREVGYQYDGVTFVEPFLGNNGSNGLFNGISDVQVVEGAGDATQGNVGSGVINLVPKRGGYPSTGLTDLEVGAPNFGHQAAFEYSWATPNGKISDYIAFNGERFTPYYGYHFTPLDQYGNYFNATMYQENNQFTNNFVFKFGRNNTQSLQVLYSNVSELEWTTPGPGGTFSVANPSPLVYYPYDQYSQSGWIAISGLTPSQYANLVNLGPGVPSINTPVPTSGQLANSFQTRFLKLEYDNSLNPTTYLALRYYNWSQIDYQDNQFSLGPTSGSFGVSAWSAVGGPTVGMSFDLTHQFGNNFNVQFNAMDNLLHPIWDGDQPQLQFLGFLLNGPGIGNGVTTGPAPTDWLPGGYVYNYFCPAGSPATCSPPRIPGWGISYNKTFFQNFGTGIRVQYTPPGKWKADVGVRYEGQNQHWFNQLEQFGQGPPSGVNPYDVPATFWTNDVLHPRELEPRASVSYQFGLNDALRVGYGRSAVFNNAQTGGTPFHLFGLDPYTKIPAQTGSLCGWIASAPSPVSPTTPVPPNQTHVWPCRSYAEELYWLGDEVEAPDAGNGKPAIYTNYDVSFNHQFKNGWGMRFTPFYKLGTNLPSSTIITVLPGGAGDIFGVANQGMNRTTGAEFNLTTPIQPVGLSGFLSMTYQNVLGTTPPLSVNETNVPLLSTATLQLGDVYRAGYVSPFVMKLGMTASFKNGLSITPDLNFNNGYPYSIGNLIAACVAACGTPNAQYSNIPQVDFGPGVTPLQQIGAMLGTSLSTNYYDPSYSGTSTNPNIAATRGTPATTANGGRLSHYNLWGDVTIQYKRGPNIIGAQIQNVFGNAFIGTVPAPNPYYQPVANGLSGPQTGYNFCNNPALVPLVGLVNPALPPSYAGIRGCTPYIPRDVYAFSNGAYLLTNGNFTGFPQVGPLAPMSVRVFFQHQL